MQTIPLCNPPKHLLIVRSFLGQITASYFEQYMSIPMSTEPLTICRPTRWRVDRFDRLKIATHLCLRHPACKFPLVLICKPMTGPQAGRHHDHGHDLSLREPSTVGIDLPCEARTKSASPKVQSATTTICVPPSCLISAQPSSGHLLTPPSLHLAPI